MGEIQKTNVSVSPLLSKPVIERDYTKGIGSVDIPSEPVKQAGPDGQQQQASQSGGLGSSPNFNAPPPPPPPPPPGSQEDYTKPFSFEEETETGSDLQDGEQGPGVTMPAGSAKAFANFVGNALQVYLPKATYNYSKVDIENIIINVQKGTLNNQWVDIFEKINSNTEEALKIPDEEIKMWKGAFKEYLEYKQMAFANPETAFYAATALLLGNQGVRAWQIRKDNERYVKEAIESSNPGMFNKEPKQPKPAQDLNDGKGSNTKQNLKKDDESIAA